MYPASDQSAAFGDKALMRSAPWVPDAWHGIMSRFFRLAYLWSINRLVIRWLAGDARITEKHVACNGLCGERSAQAAAPFDRR